MINGEMAKKDNVFYTMESSKVKCTRCHSKKTAEEFGYSKNNRLFGNYIQCREKGREYGQKYKKQDDKPSEIDNVFNHTGKLLLNDELLENYFLIFSKQDDKVILEILMNHDVTDLNIKKSEQDSKINSFATLYRIMHS